MKKFLWSWLTVSFLNLIFVAFLGVILRYKIAFYLPFLEQKNILHSHSHFAFAGWVSQTLMILLIYYLSTVKGEEVIRKYRWLLYANLFSSYGMLISFIVQGYAAVSITFSTLSIFVSYAFALFYWRDLDRLKEQVLSHLWFKWALVFSVISSLGPFSLAFMMATGNNDQNWYLASVYFYLHFQYNGWFFFAGMGLLNDKLKLMPGTAKKLYYSFILFTSACIPAYFLSILWAPFSKGIYPVLIAAVICQLAGWFLILRLLVRNNELTRRLFLKPGRVLLMLSGLAFTIKLLLQAGSIHPALSQLSYGFRPIIIGYLHLVLLGVTSIFILGYIIALDLIPAGRTFMKGIFIFVAGIIINELLLMVQGIGALYYIIVPYIQELLLGAALILLAGIGVMFISSLRAKPE